MTVIKMKLKHAIGAFLVVFTITAQLHAEPKVTQAAYVDFRGTECTVLAVEEFGKSPFLYFLNENGTTNTFQFEEDFKALDEFAYVNSFLRFKTFKINGLPFPLLIGIAVQPTATDKIFGVKLISQQNKAVKLLNPEPITLTLQDGIFLGHINKRHGTGMVTWNFQWDAAHYQPHKYEITIYNWGTQNSRFNLKSKFVTKRKFKDGCSALKYYGLPCKNFRDEVIRVEEDIGTLGIESEMLQTGENEK